MKKMVDMKRYILDQILQLVFFIIVASGLYFITRDIVWGMITIEILIACSCSYLLRRIILLPIDLLQGCVEQEVCFSQICNIEKYEFFRNKFYCEWNFYFSSKGKLTLLVPVCKIQEEILQMDKPLVNQKIRVCYYRYSKILCSWEKI